MLTAYDLEEWIIEYYPEVFEATRYLHYSAQLECWRNIYRKENKETQL